VVLVVVFLVLGVGALFAFRNEKVHTKIVQMYNKFKQRKEIDYSMLEMEESDPTPL